MNDDDKILLRRKSDEHIEIVAYIHRHKPIDNIEERYKWLLKESKQRWLDFISYGCRYNANDDYVYSEVRKLGEILYHGKNRQHQAERTGICVRA